MICSWQGCSGLYVFVKSKSLRPVSAITGFKCQMTSFIRVCVCNRWMLLMYIHPLCAQTCGDHMSPSQTLLQQQQDSVAVTFSCVHWSCRFHVPHLFVGSPRGHQSWCPVQSQKEFLLKSWKKNKAAATITSRGMKKFYMFMFLVHM